jgi:hypothetical protein
MIRQWYGLTLTAKVLYPPQKSEARNFGMVEATVFPLSLFRSEISDSHGDECSGLLVFYQPLSRPRLTHKRSDGGSTHLWNVGKLLDYTTQHPRRLVILFFLYVRLSPVSLTLFTSHINKCRRSQWPSSMKRGPRSLGRWNPGFESRLRHGCLPSSVHNHHSLVTVSSTLENLVTEKAS